MNDFLIGILSAVIASVIAFLFQIIFNDYRKKHEQNVTVDQVQRNGLQATLMSQLYDKHDYYCYHKGYATPMEKTIYQKMYNAYHSLGVNGLMTTYYNEVMGLPESDTNTK